MLSLVKDPLLQTSGVFFEMCIRFGAVKVIHSKSSDKHESSLTLIEQELVQIDLRYIGGQDGTYSECVDASIEWLFGFMSTLMSH